MLKDLFHNQQLLWQYGGQPKHVCKCKYTTVPAELYKKKNAQFYNKYLKCIFNTYQRKNFYINKNDCGLFDPSFLSW